MPRGSGSHAGEVGDRQGPEVVLHQQISNVECNVLLYQL